MKSELILSLLVIAPLLIPLAYSYDVCAVYFTGIGCPHCAKTDPVVLKYLTLNYSSNPRFIVIEYEVYHDHNYNGDVFDIYNQKYGIGVHIPNILFSSGNIVGDDPIIRNTESVILGGPQECPLPSGTEKFSQINFSSLPGRPKIWMGNSILIRNPNEKSNETEVRDVLSGNYNKYKRITPTPVPLSGKYVYFKNAIKIDGWTYEWGRTEKGNYSNYIVYGAGIFVLIIIIYLFVKR